MKHLLLVIILWLLPTSMAQEVQTLSWEDLLPEGEMERLEELYKNQSPMNFGHFDDNSVFPGTPIQIGTFNVVEDLHDLKVRIPGFVLPLEYSPNVEITEFLLVPYFGACIHTPPPPPNQIVYVTSSKPVKLGQIWNPIWATGIMKTEKQYNELGNAAYTLELTSWEAYDE